MLVGVSVVLDESVIERERERERETQVLVGVSVMLDDQGLLLDVLQQCRCYTLQISD